MHENSQQPVRIGIVAEDVSRLAYGSALTGIPGAKVTAVYVASDHVVQARARVRQFGSCRMYHDVQDLLENADIQAVMIATPLDERAEHAAQAIGRDLHVLAEQPLSSDMGAFQAIVHAAERAGIVAMPVHALRHEPAVCRATNCLLQGDIGTARELRCEWSCRAAWLQRRWVSESWMSAVAHHAIQTLDLSRQWLGEPIAVSADMDLTEEPDAPVGLATVIVQHEHGVSVHHIYRTSGTPRHEQYILTGSQGSLELTGPASGAMERSGSLRLTLRRIGQDAIAVATCQDEPVSGRGSQRSPYRNMLQSFVEAIRHQHQPPVTLEDSLIASAVFEAAVVSSREGVKVQMSVPFRASPGLNVRR